MSLFQKLYQQLADAVARSGSRLGVLQFQDGTIFSSRGGSGLFTSPRDMARIGWFWLNKFKWRGTQRLPVAYFDQFAHAQVPTTMARSVGTTPDDYLHIGGSPTVLSPAQVNQGDFPGQGTYGLNAWFNKPKRVWPNAPTDTIMFIGHRCKESMIIIPSLKIVAAWRGKEAAVGQTFAQCNSFAKLLVEAHQ